MAAGAAALAWRRGVAPTRDSTRERLRSGLVLARRSALRLLTVRVLANRAGVNLGSFVYHFGSRDAFNGELTERRYTLRRRCAFPTIVVSRTAVFALGTARQSWTAAALRRTLP